MSIIPCYKYNYAMLYVPKAACTVMRKTFIDLHFDVLNDEQQHIVNTHGHHKLETIFKEPIYPDTLYNMSKFIVCRSPYERAVSAYYDKFFDFHLYKKIDSNTTLLNANRNDWKTNRLYNLFALYNITQDVDLLKEASLIHNFFRENPTFNDVLKALSLKIDLTNLQINDSFYEYLKFLLLCKSTNIHNRATQIYDEHHNEQTYTLLRYNKDVIFSNTDIVQIENFNSVDSVFEKLLPQEIALKAKKINAMYRDQKINATLPKTLVDYKCDDKVYIDYINFLKHTHTVFDYQNLLTDKTINLINLLYSDDFNLLNYKKYICQTEFIK